MEATTETHKPMNSKGAAIFKVMLDDKRAVHEHLKKGGEPEDILNEIHLEHAAISEYLKKGASSKIINETIQRSDTISL